MSVQGGSRDEIPGHSIPRGNPAEVRSICGELRLCTSLEGYAALRH